LAPSRPGSDSLSEPIPVASRAATGRLLAQPAVFHILIALADRDRHGYSIMQDVAARTAGKVQLSAGTLYSSIRRMLEQGPIEELAGSPDPSSTGERRRYYRLTRFGRRAAADESGD
jgi:DNA-binding PadR family transcriptional regulator